MKEKVRTAIRLVEDYFKDNREGLAHSYYVADSIRRSHGENEDLYIIGLLHDILEDTECTEEILRKEFNKSIVDSIIAISRNPGEKYSSYIERVGKNKMARVVKIADLKHNMDITRLDKFESYEMKRLKKYWNSWRYLMGITKKLDL